MVEQPTYHFPLALHPVTELVGQSQRLLLIRVVVGCSEPQRARGDVIHPKRIPGDRRKKRLVEVVSP